MTYAPPTLRELAALWTANGGVNLGIVGDAAHGATGTSYHLGESQLIDGAYSARLPRDVAGLSDAASAIDLGRLDGTLVNLQTFSRWLVAWCLAGAPDTHDIREIIYSPDGFNVKRYDATTGQIYSGGTGTGQGDDSHRTHTHISYWRDSEFRDKRGPFLAYFNAPPTDADDMSRPFDVTSDQQGWIKTDLPGKTPTAIDPFTGARIPLPPDIAKRVYCLTRWRDTGVGGFQIGEGAAIVEDDGQQSWIPDAPGTPETATPLAPGLYRVG